MSGRTELRSGLKASRSGRRASSVAFGARAAVAVAEAAVAAASWRKRHTTTAPSASAETTAPESSGEQQSAVTSAPCSEWLAVHAWVRVSPGECGRGGVWGVRWHRLARGVRRCEQWRGHQKGAARMVLAEKLCEN